MLALLVPFAWTQWALGTDSTCFAYRFRAGDTLLYRIEAQDSIVLQNRPPLVRHRYETLRLVCDSVDSAAGRFWLRLTPVEFLARERQDTLEALRPHSPCLQRTVVLCMDSLGGRHSVQAPAEPLVCPGGAFQLPLMTPLEPECKRIYESWLVQDTVELVENASPAPVLVRTVLARAFPEQDTLGYRCRVLQFVATGSAFYSDGARLSSQAIVNSFARLHIAEEGFPVAGFITHELKLQLWLGGEPLPGVHYCNVFYRLAERRTPQVTAPSSGPELKRPARRPRRR
jgi:hypothetical protein